MFAATLYDIYKNWSLFSPDDLPVFAVGAVASFVSAFLCVRWLLRFVSSHDFSVFAWYRIVFGAVVLLTAQFGLVHWSA
jgi:undecaprenyl-diphosphatase